MAARGGKGGGSRSFSSALGRRRGLRSPRLLRRHSSAVIFPSDAGPVHSPPLLSSSLPPPAPSAAGTPSLPRPDRDVVVVVAWEHRALLLTSLGLLLSAAVSLAPMVHGPDSSGLRRAPAPQKSRGSKLWRIWGSLGMVKHRRWIRRPGPLATTISSPSHHRRSSALLPHLFFGGETSGAGRTELGGTSRQRLLLTQLTLHPAPAPSSPPARAPSWCLCLHLCVLPRPHVRPHRST